MKYEYKVMKKNEFFEPENEHSLNTLGRQGWELIAIVPSKSKYDFDLYYFKRVISQLPTILKGEER